MYIVLTYIYFFKQLIIFNQFNHIDILLFKKCLIFLQHPWCHMGNNAWHVGQFMLLYRRAQLLKV